MQQAGRFAVLDGRHGSSGHPEWTGQPVWMPCDDDLGWGMVEHIGEQSVRTTSCVQVGLSRIPEDAGDGVTASPTCYS